VNKNLAITLVELEATVDGRLEGKPARDIYSLLRMPARGLPILEAVCRAGGYRDVVSLDPEFNKGTKQKLTPAQWRRLAESDVVGLSAITRTANQSYELATRLRQMNPRLKIVFGGPHTTALPEEALQFGDVVVLHEGDHTFPELLDRFDDDFENPSLRDLAGICYNGPGGEFCRTAERPFLSSEELSRLPFPVLSRETLDEITHMVVNTSRGCPFECEFCSVIENFGKQFRFLDDDATIALLQDTLRMTRKTLFFGDDIFAANRARTKRILERVLREGIRLPRWFAQVRVESAQDKELLALMKRSHCSTVFIGLESVNAETLKLYNKHATVERNRQAIENYHRAGIKVHGMFVLGSDADTAQTIDDTLRFSREMRLDTAQFFALTAVPGPPLTRRLQKEGRVLCWGQWHLFDAQHAVVQSHQISPLELQKGIFEASKKFYSVHDAVGRLFSGQHRWFNFLIRLEGKYLARRIVKDNRDYVDSLRQLHEWHDRLAEEARQLAQHVRKVVDDWSLELEAKRVRLRSYLSETYKRYSETSVPEEYRIYWKRKVESTLAAIQSHFEAALPPSEPARQTD